MAQKQLGRDAAASKLGLFLQKVYTNGIYNQLNETHPDWEMVTKLKTTDEAAQSVDYMLQTSLGISGVQFISQGRDAAFPEADAVNSVEGSAGYNQLASTVEIEYDAWQRALSTQHKYVEPLANEIRSKGIAQKRILSANFYLDGRGVIGTVDSVTEPAATSRKLHFTDGSARYFEYGDRIKAAVDNTGAAAAVITTGAGTTGDWVVVDKDREADTVTIAAWDSTAPFATDTADTVVSGSECYRFGTTFSNSATEFNGTSEVNDSSQAMAGLQSLCATDGRKVHGITRSGLTGGTEYDNGGTAIGLNTLQKGLSKIKNITGIGAFNYKQALCATETLDSMINSQEKDRRLAAGDGKERGFGGFAFVHGNQKTDLVQSEYAGKSDVWFIPEGSKQSGVLELHGKDFQEVKVGGQSEFLKNDGNGYKPSVQRFMMAWMTLICKRPNAILRLKNFTAPVATSFTA